MILCIHLIGPFANNDEVLVQPVLEVCPKLTLNLIINDVVLFLDDHHDSCEFHEPKVAGAFPSVCNMSTDLIQGGILRAVEGLFDPFMLLFVPLRLVASKTSRLDRDVGLFNWDADH